MGGQKKEKKKTATKNVAVGIVKGGVGMWEGLFVVAVSIF